MNAATFAYDDKGYYNNNANSFIAGARPFLAGILNSLTAWWVLRQICTDLQNGYLQAHNKNLSEIPIPAATPAQQTEIETLVENILALKKENPAADVSALEAEIDRLVYKLYGLTDEEVKIVENKS
jgi:hypothetical protein